MTDELAKNFREIFQHEHQDIFFAPGRVNLIGEHIDYNGGLVMPAAITFGTYLLTAPNTIGKFRMRSINFDESLDIDVQNSYSKKDESWFYYPLGVIDRFAKAGFELKGLDMLYFGNIPIGSGLSSSASIEVVTAFALNQLTNAGYSKLELVKISKDVENNFIGVNSGIMDQFAVAFGEDSKALKLNCDTLDYEAVDCNLGDYLLAIINTNKPRKLAESKYNERVTECQEALKALQQELEIQNLCDITGETFSEHAQLITNEIVRKRAKHVVEENDRVHKAAKELAANNLEAFGKLMYASHDSLKNQYEVSGKELDAVVEYSLTNPNVAGARMTGAGFGGCAIALVKKDYFDQYSKELISYYTDKIGYEPGVYSSLIGDGVRSLNGTLVH
ncbi:galactokinase [Pedobacter sp. HMF7647]|uniref:Galactokinase n=1 Tax=Hufsiella arboris TaxID=2695275 RepID=A0A7K1Y9G9_9SPHI|nr:galactokinase [Hufsiella arboris]MXV51236.1 galactokinase [Hufsiella arboris]